MGQDESAPEIVDEARPEEIPIPNLFERYLDIPEVEPLMQKQMEKHIFPPELSIPSEKLHHAQEIMKIYYRSLSQQLSQNESAISYHISQQLEHYTQVARKIAVRKELLESNLQRAMNEFVLLDREVKEASDSLILAMKKADALSKAIDPSMPSFRTYATSSKS